MMLTGRPVDAEEALQIGLVNRVVPVDSLLEDAAIDYLKSISKHSKVAVNGIREAAAVAGAQLSDQGLKVERDCVIRVGKSADAEEGVAAFREKRQPNFKHC
jgi:enoyl-CoA hydratase/carnithine racemase